MEPSKSDIEQEAEKYFEQQGTDYPIEKAYVKMINSQIKSAFKAGAEWMKTQSLTSNGDGVEAIEIVKSLAEWSDKYPRSITYPSSQQAQMDGELIEIENRAKKLFKNK